MTAAFTPPTNPQKPQTLFEQSFFEAVQNRNTMPLTWLNRLQDSALESFQRVGMPSRKMEAWRYTDLSELTNLKLSPAVPASINNRQLAEFILPECQNSHLVFVNGFFHEELSNTSALPETLTVSNLLPAFKKHERLLESLISQVSNESFALMNTVFFTDAAVVIAPDETVIETPIQILYVNVASGLTPQVTYPRIILVGGENSKLTVVTSHLGLSRKGQPMLANAMVNILASEGSQISVSTVQAQAYNSFQFQTIRAHVEAGANLRLSKVSLGSRQSRNDVQITLAGEGALAELNGLNALQDKTQIFDHTVIDHQVSLCTSEQTYKGILDGSSVSEFDGTMIIRKDAQQINAAQLNNNLLLSDNAKVYTRPQLQIDADDVKCSHGATVGQLNDEELFYLYSRGIPKDTARAMLTVGFAHDLLDRLPLASLTSQLAQWVEGQLHLAPSSKTSLSSGAQVHYASGEAPWSRL